MSVLPDIDLFFFRFIQHRGPTHSILTALVIFIPFFAIYRKKAIPYFIALLQHGLVDDYIGGGNVQLLWPITHNSFGAGIDMRSPTSVSIELAMFLVATILMLLMKDMRTFFQARKSNLFLIIPVTTLLQAIIPTAVPFALRLPSFFLLTIFSAAILAELYRTFSRNT